jgi:subtilisin-like proprotein convertase family protein
MTPIPDGGSDTPGAAASQSVFVTSPSNVGAVWVTFDIPHPRQGDLEVTLTHVSTGTTAVLLSRPGRDAFHPLGFTCPNLGVQPTPTSSNLLFADSGLIPYDAPAVPEPGLTNAVGTFLPYVPLIEFRGETMAGEWRLTATDWHNGAVGYIAAFTVAFDTGCGKADFNGDGDVGTDADIADFFSCLGGHCCPTCGGIDFDGDGDVGTDADIEAFFTVLGGGSCH